MGILQTIKDVFKQTSHDFAKYNFGKVASGVYGAMTVTDYKLLKDKQHLDAVAFSSIVTDEDRSGFIYLDDVEGLDALIAAETQGERIVSTNPLAVSQALTQKVIDGIDIEVSPIVLDRSAIETKDFTTFQILSGAYIDLQAFYTSIYVGLNEQYGENVIYSMALISVAADYVAAPYIYSEHLIKAAGASNPVEFVAYKGAGVFGGYFVGNSIIAGYDHLFPKNDSQANMTLIISQDFDDGVGHGVIDNLQSKASSQVPCYSFKSCVVNRALDKALWTFAYKFYDESTSKADQTFLARYTIAKILNVGFVVAKGEAIVKTIAIETAVEGLFGTSNYLARKIDNGIDINDSYAAPASLGINIITSALMMFSSFKNFQAGDNSITKVLNFAFLTGSSLVAATNMWDLYEYLNISGKVNDSFASNENTIKEEL